MERRGFLGGITAMTTVSACGWTATAPVPRLRGIGVDVHTHVFNGRDVPVIGFVRQVIYGDHSPNLPRDLPPRSLAVLLVLILREGTWSAAREAQSLPSQTREGDQKNVAAALAKFESQSQSAATLRSAPDPDRNDALLMDMIAEQAQVPQTMMRRSADPAAKAEAYARAIYEGAPSASASTGTGDDNFEYHVDTTLITMIRWAGLLTRPRGSLIRQLISLYGGPDQIQVFVPSLIDMEMWLNDPADTGQVSPVSDQISLMATLAQRQRNHLLLNFAPFCPLRAAATRDGSALGMVRHAVQNLGFAGVKIYPPMGFRPLCNDGISFAHSRVPSGVTGADIDRELRALYGWCAAEEVPIQAHANDSMAAGHGTGPYASPAYWEYVLDEFPKLRVNMSHAGVFADEPRSAVAQTACGIRGGTDWGRIVAEMTDTRPGAFFDTGYWTEPAFNADIRAKLITRLQTLGAQYPNLHNRMMYGSDWTMIGQVPHYPAYLSRFNELLAQLYPDDPGKRADVTGANALAFILGAGGKQRDRLNRAFGDHPIWRKLA